MNKTYVYGGGRSGWDWVYGSKWNRRSRSCCCSKVSSKRLAVLLTVYSYQDSSAPPVLMVCHGLLYIWSDLQAVPLHPLSVANQDHIGGCLDKAYAQMHTH